MEQYDTFDSKCSTSSFILIWTSFFRFHDMILFLNDATLLNDQTIKERMKWLFVFRCVYLLQISYIICLTSLWAIRMNSNREEKKKIETAPSFLAGNFTICCSSSSCGICLDMNITQFMSLCTVHYFSVNEQCWVPYTFFHQKVFDTNPHFSGYVSYLRVFSIQEILSW